MDNILKKKFKILGLIPTRLNSQRLPQKALLPINDIPLIVHTYKRAKLCKKLTDVIICCDDNKILRAVKKFGAKVLLTSKHHKNGTERIYEAYKKLNKKYDLIVDIQGDEPLVSPYHIEKVVEFHEKNPGNYKSSKYLRNSARKIRKMLEISGICEKFHFFE